MLSRPRVCRAADIAKVPLITARRPAVISSPDLGVFAVAAARVFCVLFRALWTHYLNSVSAAGQVQIPLSLLFLELRGYCVKTVQLHVNAADVLVRRGIDGDGFREWSICVALRSPAMLGGAIPN
jgi:hypothetical protein